MLIDIWTKRHDLKIAELETACFDYPWSKDMIDQTVCSDNFFGLVAVEDDEVCGYAGAVCGFDIADIALVAVAPECRKRGYAFRLMTELCGALLTRGVREIFIEVRASNFAAIGLYEKCGFKKVGLRKNYYEDSEDAIVMMRNKEN